MDDLPAPGSRALLHNLVLFGRLLRAVGVRVTSGDLIQLAESLRFIDIRSRRDFREAARCTLVKRWEDLDLFEQAFDAFWRTWTQPRASDPLRQMINEMARQAPRSERAPTRKGLGRRQASPAAKKKEPRPGVSRDEDEQDNTNNESILAIYSAEEVLRSKEFSFLDDQEVADAKRFLAEMRWAVTRRRSLRLQSKRSGRSLDVRRSIRRNLRHGGELLDLAYRGPKMKRRQLVVLCDISGSMDRYTRLLLHFLHSIESSLQRTEVFVFGTRLTRITQALRKRDPDAAIATASAQVQDWSGGTRIGDSIRTFNQHWARRVMGHGAIVLVISDGWDRGDPKLLAREMERLQRGSYRLIWLNPLLGSANYRPLTQGIQAALPYVDDFLPVHNLATLEALARILNAVQEGRPSRRQTPRAQPIAEER